MLDEQLFIYEQIHIGRFGILYKICHDNLYNIFPHPAMNL